MGYITDFVVTIEAATNERRLEIVKRILQLAMIGTIDESKALAGYDQLSKTGFHTVSFDAKWYDWQRDVRGGWYSYETKSIHDGLELNEGESLSIEGFGEDDEDVWKAFVTRRKFTHEHCASIKWLNKRDTCDNCDEDETCPGCGGCADREAIFD